MEQWYALYTAPGREQEAADLLKRAVDSSLWACCRIPRKVKVFRSGGALHLLEDVMFPGYLFIKTAEPKGLSDIMARSGKFPQFIGDKKEMPAPVEESDLQFLQKVCGENLQQVMGVTKIVLNETNRIVRAEGVLNQFRDRIVKLNLHKRYAVVEVELFNRRQAVLFGVSLEHDRAG